MLAPVARNTEKFAFVQGIAAGSFQFFKGFHTVHANRTQLNIGEQALKIYFCLTDIYFSLI